ncbi:efflux transporter, outer membrane factor (OMF) lipoprotein, NodT family [Enhydrobacter aerosaccus]|uniref:Efflux transporter, outer membrane factor (OMF) lipoprotein, NodT family n=1 Tax=Enhydrobacter aerosaccus TaxID=225324 RepID=A0A1T4PR19_9HYPH|nr:efflux transporter outer membrane subunit [Enhydrobacter aerosaccus]SJZ93338.1 efflux transporter, outer membrane factor (OMF) lipoprotein, NodT family [Enhydrobacter aerosaccus]
MNFRTVIPFLVLFPVAACAVGPDYQRPPPASDPPAAYKEVNGITFRPAAPRDTIDRGPWWTIYADPTLDRLMAQVDVSNQTLKENEAAYRQAVALLRQSQSGLFPTFGYTGSIQQVSSSGGRGGAVVSTGSGFVTGTSNGSVGQYSIGSTISWEVDVWGRIRRTIESDAAAAQASKADLDAARLSAQSSLATSYFSLRISDERRDLYNRSIAAYARSLQIVQNQMNAGTASRLDLAQAQTLLEQTRALYAAEAANRAQFEHAVAALVGKIPAEVSIETAPPPATVPTLEAGAPSALLERRPDIAAAERTMQSANAQIGVAQAAYYPDFTFNASISFLTTTLSNLLQIGSAVWSIGPQLSGTLLDGGAMKAAVEGARANYDKMVATYRQTVITAFQQVEDALAQQNYFAQQEEIQRRAVAAARDAERLSLNQYQAGTAAYTTVVTAQQTALSAEQTLINIRLNRLTASATLVAALGGGWRDSDLPALIPPSPKTLPKPSPVKKGWWPF